MRKAFLLFVFVLLMTGCTKEVFLIEEPEPPEQNQSPGGFTIDVVKITDTELKINWSGSVDPESEIINYDVAVNDSVVGYDIELTNYTITGLTPDKSYKIGVIAHDKNYNTTQKEISIKTYKSFFHSFYSFDLGYDEQSIMGNTKTSDGGFLICGVANPYQLYRLNYNNFVAKINPDYSVAWHKRFDWDLQGNMSALECNDGTFLVAWTNTVKKLNASGEDVWTYKCPISYNIESLSIIQEFDNGEILLSGVKLGSPMNYSIIKLDQLGKEVQHKWGGIYPTTTDDFVTTPSGETLILGKTGKISEDGVFKLYKQDSNGNLLNEYVYPNKFSGVDVVHSITKADEDNYILAGSTYGYVTNLGIDFCPHIIKVNSSGKIIWDKYFVTISNKDGFYRTLKSFVKINSDQYLLFVEDNKGFTIAFINSEGEITDFKRASSYPNERNFTINNLQQYVLLTDYGVLVLDPEGYTED